MFCGTAPITARKSPQSNTNMQTKYLVLVYPTLKCKGLLIIIFDLVLQLVFGIYIMILKITLYELPTNYGLMKFETKE